jgi:hypothetical protein
MVCTCPASSNSPTPFLIPNPPPFISANLKVHIKVLHANWWNARLLVRSPSARTTV